MSPRASGLVNLQNGLGIVSAAAALLACGGPQVPETAPAPGPGEPYKQACAVAQTKRAEDVAAKKYLPTELIIHQWPGRELDAGRLSLLKEEELAAALAAEVTPGQARVRTVLVLARGGTGKSRLAESLTALSCGKVPMFRLDLNLDAVPRLAKAAPGQNVLAAALAEQLGQRDPAQAEAFLTATLGTRPWVVVLDALDETPLLQREALAKQIDELVTRVAPQARALVMTRPPVFASNYGISTVDARLELPNLTCEESQAALARNVSDPQERQKLDHFLEHYGLGRKVTTFDRCYYPHLATHRDVQVVQRLAKNAAIGQDAQDFKDFQNSRAQVYTYFVTAQLLRDLQGVVLKPSEAIAVVDKMVAAVKPDAGQRNLAFKLEDCVAVSPVSDLGAKQVSCERLLQSALFKPTLSKETGREGGVQEFRFDNQSLGDLFLARWAAHALVGPDGKVDCKAVESKALMLESNEVGGFLVGQPEAQGCLLEISQTMCTHIGMPQHIFEQFDQGLPSGPPRVQILKEIQDDLKVLPKVQPCVVQLYDGLAKTVEGLAPPQSAAPAPADKSSEGKGKKPKK